MTKVDAARSRARGVVLMMGVALAGLGLAGCQAGGAASPAARLPVQGEHAIVAVEGGGRVVGGAIACAPDGGRCEATFDDLWATPLAAEAAPGWRFAGWSRRTVGAALGTAPAERPTTIYTARFESTAAGEGARDVASR